MGVEQGGDAAVTDPPKPRQFDEWLGELRRYVHRLTGDADLAEDVAQDAMVRLLTSQEKGEVRSPRAWLYRAATNMVRDQARHMAMRMRRPPPADLDAASTPEDDLERRETILEVRRALDRISARDRELLILRESGFKYREIAGVIGVKTESVPVLAARALARFRTAYLAGAGE